MLAVLTALLLIAGLLVSRSRGGIAVMAAAVPVLVVLVAFSRSLRAGVITVVTIAVLVVVPLAVIGVGNVSGFIGERAAAWLNPWEGEIRTLGRQAARHISGDYPLFGTGLGTFVNVYPSYKVRGPMLYFAHCDVLQWKAEMGWVGMILAAAILLATLFTVVTGWFRIKDPFFRRLLVGITLGCAACLMHGLVDYPLRIPGVAIVFVALAALSVVVARDRVARHEESDFVF
jgi:O-antigen ligase